MAFEEFNEEFNEYMSEDYTSEFNGTVNEEYTPPNDKDNTDQNSTNTGSQTNYQYEQHDNQEAQDNQRHKKSFHRYKRLSTAELINTPTPLEYLIDGYIQREAMHLLFGESGCKKTFIALDLAMHIACNKFTHWCDKTIDNHGLVIYLAGEGTRGIRKRLYAQCLKHNISPEDGNLVIIDEAFHLNTDDENYNIDNTIENIKEICEEKGQNPVLIIIDTLNRFLEGHENDTQSMSGYIHSCDKLSREFNTATLSIHHCGLATESKDRPRGSSALFAACDIVIKAEIKEEHTNLDQTKNKDAEKITGLKLDFEEITLPPEWNRKNGTPETSLVPRLSPYSTHNNPEAQKAERLHKRKLNTKQIRGRKSFENAAKEFGIFIQDEETGHELAAVCIEDWRKISYRDDSADNESTQRGHFNNDRRQLLEYDGLLTKRIIGGQEYYCIDLEVNDSETNDEKTMKLKIICAIQNRNNKDKDNDNVSNSGVGAA